MIDNSLDCQHKPPLLDELLGYKLRKASSMAMATMAEALGDIGLKVSEMTVMYRISQEPNSTSSHLGKVLDIKRANMTPIISGLMDRGLVSAKRRDGRSQGLFLSREGEKWLEQARTVINQHEKMLATNLSEAERENLCCLMNKVLSSMKKKKNSPKRKT